MRRPVLLIAVLAATPLHAEAPAPAGDAVAGAALYDAACSRCHRDIDDLRAGLDPDPAIAAADLDAKLARHHADDPEMRADIVAFLLSLE